VLITVPGRVEPDCQAAVAAILTMALSLNGAMVSSVIPAALTTDRCPASMSDRPDAVGIRDQEIPGIFASGDDRVITIPDGHAEFVASKIVPDILHAVKFWRVWWNWQKSDVVRNPQPATFLVPSGTVAHQDRVRAWCDLSADFLEMFTHCFAVGRWHDDCRTHRARRANRAEQIDRVMPVIPHHRRTRADRCPNIFEAAFLADPGFVLEPNLDRFSGCRGGQGLFYKVGEFFLKAVSASGLS